MNASHQCHTLYSRALHRVCHQRGSMLLPNILILLALSLLMLGSQQLQADSMMRQRLFQRHYLSATTNITSALNLASQQSWLPGVPWQCVIWNDIPVCVRLSQRKGLVLMRVSSKPFLFGAQVSQYRYFFQSTDAIAQPLSALPAGWIDFCPEPNEKSCD